MNRLESCRDFEASRDPSRELEGLRPDRVGMRFHGDCGERRCQLRNAEQVLRGNGALIKEVARVVKLEPIPRLVVARIENALELPGQRTTRRRAVKSPLPEVTERARERTLRAGEKNREGLLDLSIWPALVLEHRTVRRVCIYGCLARPKTPNSVIVVDSRTHE